MCGQGVSTRSDGISICHSDALSSSASAPASDATETESSSSRHSRLVLLASVLQHASCPFLLYMSSDSPPLSKRFATAKSLRASLNTYSFAKYGISAASLQVDESQQRSTIYSQPTSQQTSNRAAPAGNQTLPQPWTPHQHRRQKRPTWPRPPRRTASAAIMMCARSPLPRMKL